MEKNNEHEKEIQEMINNAQKMIQETQDIIRGAKGEYVNTLYDSTIESKIVVEAGTAPTIPLFFMFFIIWIGRALYMFHYFNNFYAMHSKSILFVSAILLGALYWTILNLVGKIIMEKAKIFAKENFNKSKLFKTKYIKIDKKINSSRRNYRYTYFIEFKNEKGKNIKVELKENEYNIYKENINQDIYVVEIPKYKRGHLYITFNGVNFVNKSSIENISYIN